MELDFSPSIIYYDKICSTGLLQYILGQQTTKGVHKLKIFTRKSKDLLLKLAAALTILVIAPSTAHAILPLPSAGQIYDGVDFSALAAPNTGIYFGKYNHATGFSSYEGVDAPILWRVMGEEAGDGKITVLSEYVLDYSIFDTTNNDYNGSSIMNTALDSIYNGSFIPSEQMCVASANLSTRIFNHNVGYNFQESPFEHGRAYPISSPNQKLYLPWGRMEGLTSASWINEVYIDSANDVNSPLKLGEDTMYANRTFNQASLRSSPTAYVAWWLRSPSFSDSLRVHSVNSLGEVVGNNIGSLLGVRPAFKLDPVTIIFATEIVSSGGDGMSSIDQTSDYALGAIKNFKLTVVNTSLSLANLHAPGIGSIFNGSTINISSGEDIDVQGSLGGGASDLAYKIVDNNRSIVMYGIANNLASARLDTGTLPIGTYTVYVWAQKNNNIYSHEGSIPVYFTLNTGITSMPDNPASTAPVILPPDTGDRSMLSFRLLALLGAMAAISVVRWKEKRT